jgi:hypothetical protein
LSTSITTLFVGTTTTRSVASRSSPT